MLHDEACRLAAIIAHEGAPWPSVTLYDFSHASVVTPVELCHLGVVPWAMQLSSLYKIGSQGPVALLHLHELGAQLFVQSISRFTSPFSRA
jgi:hypothetical protein